MKCWKTKTGIKLLMSQMDMSASLRHMKITVRGRQVEKVRNTRENSDT